MNSNASVFDYVFELLEWKEKALVEATIKKSKGGFIDLKLDGNVDSVEEYFESDGIILLAANVCYQLLLLFPSLAQNWHSGTVPQQLRSFSEG
jgi:hypothetical protein